jgi:hypothetical protein
MSLSIEGAWLFDMASPERLALLLFLLLELV